MKATHFQSELQPAPSASRWRWLAAAVMFAVVAVNSSAARAVPVTVIVDDFTQVNAPSPWLPGSPNNHNGIDGLDLTLELPNSYPIPTNPPVGAAYDESGMDSTKVLGGARRSELLVTASNPPAQQLFEIAMINILPAGTGIFTFEAGLTVIAQTSLIYNGTLPDGLSSAFVTFNNYDFEDQQPLPVQLDIDDGLGGVGQITRQLNQVANIGFPVDLELPLDQGEFSGVNFGGPVKLTFTFFGNLADDFGLEQIVIEADTQQVPEPSSWALAGFGLVGLAALGLVRRRRNSTRKLNSVGLPSNPRSHQVIAPSNVLSPAPRFGGLRDNPQRTEIFTMSRIKLFLASATCALLLLGSTSHAFAALILKIDDGNTVKTIYDEDFVPSSGTNPDQLPGAGAVLYAGSHGSYSFVVSTGTSKPAQGSATVPRLTLTTNATSMTANAGMLTISLTDTDFTGVPPAFDSGVTTIANGTVSVMTYADFTNAAFGTGFALSTLGPFVDVPAGSPGTLFIASDQAAVAGVGPYSLTIVTQIFHTAVGTTQVNSEVVSVPTPEPSTVAMASLGFVGLMALGWRQSRRKAA